MFTSVLSLGLFFLSLVRAGVHNIVVGGSNGTLVFQPEAISASPGDQVVFTFQQKNHSAVRSSFDNPCGPTDGGFDSGFFPVDANATDNFPTYTISVNDTNPIWVYCSQAAGTPNSHCGKGMVFAVNCGADGSPNSFTNFKNAALAIGAQLAAGNTSTLNATDPYATGNASSPVAPVPYATGNTSSPDASDPYAIGNASTPSGSDAYPYSPPAPCSDVAMPASAPAAAAPATHIILVGVNNSLTFTPSELSAQPNDVVLFQFQTKNHTVTQSSFDAPCQKLASTQGTAGFDSGFMPVSANATTFPTYNITVNNADPIWLYCAQDGHCGQGMVLAINAPADGTKSFIAFQAAAKQINRTASASYKRSESSSSPSPSSAAGAASRTGGVATACLGLFGAVVLLLL